LLEKIKEDIMKVLKERKPFEDWKLEVSCTGGEWNQEGKVPCGSALEINANDLINRAWSKYPDSGGVDYGFICPICKCFTNIKENNLTDYLKDMARDYLEIKDK
jgi:hypothetical protein